MSIKISALPTMVTVDRAADFLPIVDTSGVVTDKVTPNVMLGITGNPIGTSDSQTMTNKTITSPTISGPTLSGTVIGTYTIGGTPTFPSSVTTLTGIQTLTNKTLTSPTITGGSIDNTTITVDSISGHTTSTIVTVGGVQMNNGIVGTTGAVNTNSILAGAVVPNSLVASSGSGWGWQSFVPSWTNLTVGNATQTAQYQQIGKTVFVNVLLILGNTSSVGTGPSFTPPVSAASIYNNGSVNFVVGTGLLNAGANTSQAAPGFNAASNKIGIFYFPTATTFAAISATTPGTWTTANIIALSISYQAA